MSHQSDDDPFESSVPLDTDETPALDPSHHGQREHYIPLPVPELMRRLEKIGELSAEECAEFARLERVLATILHNEYHRRLTELKSRYAPFDPDTDPECVERMPAEQRTAAVADVFDGFLELLERANFQRLSRDEIHNAMRAASFWGVNLRVDFDVFERLDVFARGDIVGQRTRRRWRRFNKPETVDVPIYQRLLVVFRLKPSKRLQTSDDTDNIHIKYFKNIPKMDLEMLLPGSRIRMSLFDQSRILLPTVSGLGLTLWKAITGAAVVVLTGVNGLIAFLLLAGGTLGYGVKSFFGYLNTRNRYQLNVTRSLYYQNLDNNAGVLFRLIDEGEEQDLRETLLAYFVLWRQAGPAGWSSDELDSAAEKVLLQLLEIDVDFEVHDATTKLKRFGLAEQLPNGRWRAIPPQAAYVRLKTVVANVTGLVAYSHWYEAMPDGEVAGIGRTDL